MNRAATGDGCGADDEIRTRDIDLGKVALYQLSYIRAGTPGEASRWECYPGPWAAADPGCGV